MQDYSFPATITEIAPGDFELRFRDVPEAITGGATVQAALAEGHDALAGAIEGYLALGRVPPRPSEAQAGDHMTPLEPALAARSALLGAMAEQGLSNRALAARLGWDETAVRRVLSGQAVSADRLLFALRAVGLQPALSVMPRASVAAPAEAAPWLNGASFFSSPAKRGDHTTWGGGARNRGRPSAQRPLRRLRRYLPRFAGEETRPNIDPNSEP